MKGRVLSFQPRNIAEMPKLNKSRSGRMTSSSLTVSRASAGAVTATILNNAIHSEHMGSSASSVGLRSLAPKVVRATAVETLEATSTAVVEKSINTILAIDAVEKSNSEHPGLPMGCTPMGHILYDEGAQLEISKIGTNTAELGYLGVPMVVVLPTHVLQAFRGATGGLMGLLLKLPGKIGDMTAYLMNFVKLKTSGFVSWPNRWAKQEIIPELIGRIEPKDVAIKVIELLESPSTLKNMQSALLRVSNEQKQKLKLNETEHQDGPAIAIAHIVDDLVNI